MSLLPSLKTRSLKFEEIGAAHSGKLVEIGPEQQQTEYEKETLAYWDEGKTRPKMQRVFKLETTLRDADDPGDDGVRNLYATVSGKPGGIYHAINKALEGHSSLGGQLTVTYTGDDPESKNPKNPRKLYSAVYVPGALLPDTATSAPGAPAPTPAPAAAPATPAVDVNAVPDGVAKEMWEGMGEAQRLAYLTATGKIPAA